MGAYKTKCGSLRIKIEIKYFFQLFISFSAKKCEGQINIDHEYLIDYFLCVLSKWVQHSVNVYCNK